MASDRKPSTEMNREEFDFHYPPGSEMRREEEALNPRPDDEQQSSAEMSQSEVDEFRAWKASQQHSTNRTPQVTQANTPANPPANEPVKPANEGEVPEDQWRAHA